MTPQTTIIFVALLDDSKAKPNRRWLLRLESTRSNSFLLIDALRRAVHISDQIGIRAVEVNAINNSARKFYLKYGFVPLRDDSHHLFLPIRVIRKLKLPPL